MFYGIIIMQIAYIEMCILRDIYFISLFYGFVMNKNLFMELRGNLRRVFDRII